MASPASSKKQIIQNIKDKKSVLVTVSNNPTLDELSAALGLTIFLNKLDKHATAIVSGEIPSALDFLDPEKTFEATADSLRDFIIALDKEKADHLRYKLDGDVVKIFITPYRNTITQDDLEFSQGDYNVELVLALNVADRDDLDRALAAHGKILHDATVMTLTVGDIKSGLGVTDWHEDKVSGVSEMVTEIVQSLKTAKADIDEQIATALLTGIVASTDRFSNELTSSKVMTMSAELMASGANQQLIASKLEQGGAVSVPAPLVESEPSGDMAMPIQEVTDDPTVLSIDRGPANDEPAVPVADTEVAPVTTPSRVNTEYIPGSLSLDEAALHVMEQSQVEAAREAEQQLSQMVEPVVPVQDSVPDQPIQEAQPDGIPQVVPDINAELQQATDQMVAEADPLRNDQIISKISAPDPMGSIPTVGGTLNATAATAAEEKRAEILRGQNRTILKHGPPLASTQPVLATDHPMNAAMATQADEPPTVDIFSEPPASIPGSGVQGMDLMAPPVQQEYVDQAPNQQPAPYQLSDQQAAMDDVQAAFNAPVEPVPAEAAGMPTFAPSLEDISEGLVMPPMPDFNSLPPLPPAPVGIDPATGLPTLPTAPPDAAAGQEFNPSQFQIPPQ